MPQQNETFVVLWNGKADGNSGGGIAFSIVGDHENRPTDMTNLVVSTEYTDERADSFGV